MFGFNAQAEKAMREGRFADQDFYDEAFWIVLNEYQEEQRRWMAEPDSYPPAPDEE